MKQLIFCLLLGACLVSCQKKKKTEETPNATSTTGVTPTSDPMISVKVNDSLYTCPALACVSGYKSGGIRGLAIGDQSAKKHLFRFTFTSMPTPGLYTLGNGSSASLQYVNSSTYYSVVIGTLDITEVDTTDRGVINRMVAKFSAKTDTTLQAPYSVYRITDGIIKIK